MYRELSDDEDFDELNAVQFRVKSRSQPSAADDPGDLETGGASPGKSPGQEAPPAEEEPEETDEEVEPDDECDSRDEEGEEEEPDDDVETELSESMKAKLEEYVQALPEGFYPPKDPAGKPENFGGVWNAGWC